MPCTGASALGLRSHIQSGPHSRPRSCGEAGHPCSAPGYPLTWASQLSCALPPLPPGRAAFLWICPFLCLLICLEDSFLTFNDQPSFSSFPEPSIALPDLLRSPVPKLSANWCSPACYQLAKSPTTSCIKPGEERPEHSTMLTTDQETEPERSRATAEATQQGGGELPVKSACLSAPMWELSPPQAAEAQQEEPWGLL